MAVKQAELRFLFLTLAVTALVSCVEPPRHARLVDNRPAFYGGNADEMAATRININTASREELEKLPGVGQSLATRIIEHHEQYGPFRRAEHLIAVRGISDRRFRQLRALVCVE